MNLMSAEQRAAAIRAESAALEEAEMAEAEAKSSKEDKKPSPKIQKPEPDYKALAAAEEKRAAELKVQADALQAELDPEFAKANRKKQEVPHVVLTELLNRHDNAEDALNALHDAIRQMREQPGLNEKPRNEWPADLSHLTDAQRAKTLAEMEAGRRNSERAAATVARTKEIHAELKAKDEMKHLELDKLRAQLAEANATIAVLRHNPSVNEVFPTVADSKVTSAGI